MAGYQEKSQGIIKGKKTQSEETKQISKPDITGILELSEQGFKIAMINILRTLIIK